MEFIITGLFIIFFSYILLYSLYDFLFKRSTIEGLDKTKKDAKTGDKKDSGSSDQAKATAGLNKANSANGKIAAHNTKHEQMTLVNSMSGVNKTSNKIT
jgi:hypothetical protein